MLTLMSVACVALGATVVDAAAKELAADVRLAMKRADLSLDYVSRVLGVPGPRLSDQLLGKLPFTYFWRFTAREIRESDFWTELLAIEAERYHATLVLLPELSTLIHRVEELVGHKPMARMDLPPAASEKKVG